MDVVEPCEAEMRGSVTWLDSGSGSLLVVAVVVAGGVCSVLACRLVLLRSSTMERQI